MNLMFYDFNSTKPIPEENQRNMLRSQTTDRGPSRQLRSRGRFKLASSNQQKRGEEDPTGFGEIRPFGVSTEFEMGMYPPGSAHPHDELAGGDSMNMGVQPSDDPIDMNFHSSPGAAMHNNSSNQNRNI